MREILENIQNNNIDTVKLEMKYQLGTVKIFDSSELTGILTAINQNHSIAELNILYYCARFNEAHWHLLINIIRTHPTLNRLSFHPKSSTDNIKHDLLMAICYRNSNDTLPNIDIDLFLFVGAVELNLRNTPFGNEIIDVLLEKLPKRRDVNTVDLRGTAVTVDGIFRLYNGMKNYRRKKLTVYHDHLFEQSEHKKLLEKIQNNNIEDVDLSSNYSKNIIRYISKLQDELKVANYQLPTVNPTCMKVLNFSSEEPLLAVAFADKTIRIIKIGTEVNCLQILRGHTAAITCLERIFDTVFASGSKDGTIRIWSINDGNCLRVLEEGSSINCLKHCPSYNLAYDCHEESLISGSDTAIRDWDYKNGRCLQTAPGLQDEVPIAFFMEDEKRQYRREDLLIVGNRNGSIKLWEIRGIKNEKPTVYLSEHKYERHTGLQCVGFSGEMLGEGSPIVSGSQDGTIAMWTLSGLERTLVSGHSDEISCLIFTPASEQEHKEYDNPLNLISNSKDGTLIFWDFKTIEAIHKMKVAYPIFSIEILPNGDLICLSSNGIIKLKLGNAASNFRLLLATQIIPSDLELTEILSALVQNSSVKTLDLAGLILNNDQYRLVAQIVETHPDLNYSLFLSLKTNNIITKLDLSELQIGDNIINTLIDIFSENSTIAELNLQNTQITLEGAKRLYEAVKDREPALVIDHDGLLKYLDEQQEVEENNESDDNDDYEVNSHSFVPGF